MELEEGRLEPPLSAPGGAVIGLSASTANLFSRADEGLARKDWKLVVDSLQRIVESQDSSLVAAGESDAASMDRFESVQWNAVRRLSNLPAEGLAAYRLIYDGRAKGMLDRASASGDEEGLRTIVERFLLTRYGDDAADRLASWLLDAGRPAEALHVLHLVLDVVADHDVSDADLWGKVAVANAMLGRNDDALRALQSLELGASEGTPESRHVALIRRFIEQNEGRWPSMSPGKQPLASARGGGTDSFHPGIGPSVEPTFVEPLPWVFSFGAPATGGTAISDDCDPDDAQPLPPWQAVVDGNRVYVRFAQGVAALRASDLQPIWATRETPTAWLDTGQTLWEILQAGMHSWIRPPDDDLFGSISTSRDLVFAIDRQGTGSAAEVRELFWAQRFGRMRGRLDAVGGRYLANRLAAYDAETGELVWSRGRSLDRGDELGDAEFRSVPLAVGDELWVPYFRHRDYFVGVFDPKDGSLRHEIPLCSIEARAYARRPAQPISYGYGTVYVPSGHGILFAVDAKTHTMRWATRYAAHPEWEADEANWYGGQWRATAPVVASGLVLLCAADFPELLAFSADTGRLRWMAPVLGGSYPIAADRHRVWFGGSIVSSLSLEDGRELWSKRLNASPVGRAVRSGDRLFVPTSEGLVTLDALTGETLSLDRLPRSQTPLGNLVCGAEALFSVGSFGVRLYPDLAKSYATAGAHFETSPHDESAAYDLAWLELFQSSSERALAVLESHRAAVGDDGGRGEHRLAGVWVEVLLTAASVADKASEAIHLYERAGREARSAADRLRCAFALADQRVSMGENLRACRALWAAGLGADGEEDVSLSMMVRGSARLAIGERLRRIEEDLSESERSELRRYVNEELDQATQRLSDDRYRRESLRRLRALAEMASDSREGQRALLELGRFRFQQARFEPAEQFLLAAIRSGVDRSAAAASLMVLCDVYRLSQPDDIAVLAARLEELRSRFAADLVPELYGPRSEDASGAVVDGATIGDWVESMKNKLPSDGVPHSNTMDRMSAFVLSGEKAWTLATDDSRVVGRMAEFDTPEGDVPTGRLVFLSGNGFGSCVSTENGQELWKIRLRLPERFRDSLPSVAIGTDVSRRAVASGQTAVFAGRDGYFAVGLVSGKRLWSVPYAGDAQTYDPWYADMRMAIGEGVVAVLTGPHRLALLRLADGDTIWERDLQDESITYLWMLNGIVLTADERLERIHMLDREDGRLVKRILFRQPDPDDRPVRMAHTAGIICGPNATASRDAIFAVDATTGETRWEKTLEKPLVHLFVPQEGYIGVGMLSGGVLILDAQTGETILDRDFPVGRAAEFGVLTDGLLVVQHAIAVAAGRRRSPSLIAIDIATGEVVWVRLDLAVAGGVNGSLLVIDGVIPAIVKYPGEGAARFRAEGLVMIDARTGKNIGADVKLVSKNSQARVLNDFRIMADRIVVGTEKKYVALHTEPFARHTVPPPLNGEEIPVDRGETE
ncbi:MAG: PQQ-binding-like beta-propeller repeat protein [Planctomycetes bacterium]|nr:PQQ-binding-like beta-propeller repeat protein [Planctomycetota bacterium]